jgi:hypothetical protein
MKKVLLGLVIVIMMTGSGYADFDKDECKYLRNSAETWASMGKDIYNALTEAVKEQRTSDFAPLSKEELDNIKNAHYFAVTWSALCD